MPTRTNAALAVEDDDSWLDGPRTPRSPEELADEFPSEPPTLSLLETLPLPLAQTEEDIELPLQTWGQVYGTLQEMPADPFVAFDAENAAAEIARVLQQLAAQTPPAPPDCNVLLCFPYDQAQLVKQVAAKLAEADTWHLKLDQDGIDALVRDYVAETTLADSIMGQAAAEAKPHQERVDEIMDAGRNVAQRYQERAATMKRQIREWYLAHKPARGKTHTLPSRWRLQGVAQPPEIIEADPQEAPEDYAALLAWMQKRNLVRVSFDWAAARKMLRIEGDQFVGIETNERVPGVTVKTTDDALKILAPPKGKD